MSTLGTVALATVPVATALVGARAGARWQSGTAKEAELRSLLDRGTVSLPQIALKLGWARAFLEREGPGASPASRSRLEDLDAARVSAEEIGDLIRTHAGEDHALFRHFVDALRAAEIARDEMIRVADLPPEERWDLESSLSAVDNSRSAFQKHRTAFLHAAHERISKRRF